VFPSVSVSQCACRLPAVGTKLYKTRFCDRLWLSLARLETELRICQGGGSNS
jgi:hypothetical protein